jgi:2-succinyl-5-enolpyruvyl-6-hydroxy-3-cyclohexene-1-carboxylate synthase
MGAPVGANRGASGIDGVLSAAAGFAFGLARCSYFTLANSSFAAQACWQNLVAEAALAVLSTLTAPFVYQSALTL